MDANDNKHNTSQRFSAHPSSALYCDFHDEQIFNFCLNLECLKPLCPECINEHQSYHDEKYTKPEFTTLRAVKSSCSKKIDAGIMSLNQEVKKCELEYLLDPEALIDTGLKRLKKFKERLYLMIDGHCSMLEELLKQRVHENLLKGSDFEGIFEEMKNIINELEYLRKNLESSNGLNYIKKICMLDLKALMKEFKYKVQKVIKTKDLEPIDIHIDETKFQSFKTELENMIYIKKDRRLDNSEVQQQQNPNNISQNSLHNISQNNPKPQYSAKNSAKNSARNSPRLKEVETKREKDPKEPLSSKFRPGSQHEVNLPSDNNDPIDKEPRKEVVSVLRIEIPDYYTHEARKTLHFFQRNKKILNILDLDALATSQELSFKKFHLNNEIPGFNKSISLPDGQIYLIGGQLTASSSSKCAEIYRFSERDVELQQVGTLEIPRSCHGLCAMNEYIYVIGGYSKGGLCDQNERYNCLTKKSERLNDKTKFVQVAYPNICNFRYAIFKFGGIGANNILSQTIEKFDCVSEEWETIMVKNSKRTQILMNSACTQINHSDILLLGGQDADERGSKQCLLFKYEKNYPETGYFVDLDSNFSLPSNNGFVHNEGVWYDGQAYFVQNKEANNKWNEEEKNIMVLNSREWRILK